MSGSLESRHILVLHLYFSLFSHMNTKASLLPVLSTQTCAHWHCWSLQSPLLSLSRSWQQLTAGATAADRVRSPWAPHSWGSCHCCHPDPYKQDLAKASLTLSHAHLLLVPPTGRMCLESSQGGCLRCRVLRFLASVIQKRVLKARDEAKCILVKYQGTKCQNQYLTKVKRLSS